MRLNLLFILGASMLATAGLSAQSNIAGAFDLQGALAQCSGDTNCEKLANDQNTCWSSGKDPLAITKCVQNAQDAYNAAVSGTADASISAATTDATNWDSPEINTPNYAGKDARRND